MKKLALSLVTLALAVAQAASSTSVQLTAPMTAAGTQLKAGDYKVQVEGNAVTFKAENKKAITVPATTVTGTEKFRYTTMESEGSTLKSIHVGGTDTTIVFTSTSAANGGN
jgi:hypothetical protein